MKTKKFLSFLLAVIVSSTFIGVVATAANPSSPFSAGENVQDPGDTGTAWGGCGPTDSNCYVTFSMPASTAPTVDSDGELAYDSSVTDLSTGLITFYGTEEQGVISLPIGDFSSLSDGYAVVYDATDDEFELASVGGASALTGLSDCTTDYATDFNMFCGDSAGANIASGGQYNLGIGQNSLNAVTTGDANMAIGYNTLAVNTASNNLAFGMAALDVNTSGTPNLAIGRNALGANVSGANNIAIGYQALLSNTDSGNIAIGANSLDANVGGTSNIAIGLNAMTANTSGDTNTGIGNQALYTNIGGSNLVALGANALYDNTYGNANIGIGYSALFNNITASSNVAVGEYALYTTETGASNVAVGASSLRNNTGSLNTAVGHFAMYSNGANSRSTAVGYQANYYADDDTSSGVSAYNTSLGYQALYGSTTAANNTGTENTALGANALESYTTGSANIAIGYLAGSSITTGNGNILIGNSIDATSGTAGDELNIGDTLYGDLANGEIGIGDSSPDYRLDVEHNTTTHVASFFNDGNGADRVGIRVQAGLDDHTAAGPSTLVTFADGDGGTVGSITFGSSLTAYNTSSDERLKDNIEDTSLSIDNLMDIEVRDYTWRADKDEKISHGFIAQELYEVYPLAVTIPTDDNEYYMVDYSKLMPLAIKSIQDLKLEIDEMNEFEEEGSRFGQMLRAWLANASNKITRIFTGEVCLTEAGEDPVCLNRAELVELKDLLEDDGSNNYYYSGTSTLVQEEETVVEEVEEETQEEDEEEDEEEEEEEGDTEEIEEESEESREGDPVEEEEIEEQDVIIEDEETEEEVVEQEEVQEEDLQEEVEENIEE